MRELWCSPMASISKRGPVWRAMVRRRGETLTATFDSRADAEAWADREEARIMAGATAAQIRATPSSLTVADLLDRYAREVSPRHICGPAEASMLAKLGRMIPRTVASFDRSAAAEWRDNRLRQVSAGSVIREMSLMSSVWKHAILEWRAGITVNPWKDLRKPTAPPSRDRRVSDAERAAVIAELGWDGVSTPDDLRAWIAWSFCLAIETMMRRGEILGMTWQHVHLNRRFVHLPKTKNGTKRDVPLSSAALALFNLVERAEDGARVVPVTTPIPYRLPDAIEEDGPERVLVGCQDRGKPWTAQCERTALEGFRGRHSQAMAAVPACHHP